MKYEVSYNCLNNPKGSFLFSQLNIFSFNLVLVDNQCGYIAVECNPNNGEQDQDEEVDQTYTFTGHDMPEICDSDDSIVEVRHFHSNDIPEVTVGKSKIVTSTYVWFQIVFLFDKCAAKQPMNECFSLNHCLSDPLNSIFQQKLKNFWPFFRLQYFLPQRFEWKPWNFIMITSNFECVKM